MSCFRSKNIVAKRGIRMNCFNCNNCGIVTENKQFRCALNYKLIAVYSNETIPHLTKTTIDVNPCERHSSIRSKA